MISNRPSSSEAGESSSRKPRLGFLGVGWIGHQRMLAIAESGAAEIVAVADPSAEYLEKAGEKVSGFQPLRTFEELLACELDGLVIATPSAQHSEQSIRALEAGLAVFCQKPLGRNEPEARRVIAAAKRADRLLAVDLSYRHTAPLRAIRQLIRQGELGRIFAVDLIFHNAYGPQRPWFYQPQESGGGCVMDLGIHLVDAALWMLEDEVVGVRSRLFCQGEPIQGRAEKCEDFATARLDLAGGGVVNLACSWNLHAGQDAVIEASFYGTQGGARMCNYHGSFTEFGAERFHGTSSERISQPPDAWGGRAAVAWAEQLARSQRYHPEIESMLPVAAALDAIYAGAALH